MEGLAQGYITAEASSPHVLFGRFPFHIKLFSNIGEVRDTVANDMTRGGGGGGASASAIIAVKITHD